MAEGKRRVEMRIDWERRVKGKAISPSLIKLLSFPSTLTLPSTFPISLFLPLFSLSNSLSPFLPYTLTLSLPSTFTLPSTFPILLTSHFLPPTCLIFPTFPFLPPFSPFSFFLLFPSLHFLPLYPNPYQMGGGGGGALGAEASSPLKVS